MQDPRNYGTPTPPPAGAPGMFGPGTLPGAASNSPFGSAPHIFPAAEPEPKTDGRATMALTLGICSVFCLGFFTGIPAVVLGLLAKRDIDRSDGKSGGAGLAIGGIVTGMFGTLASLAFTALFAMGALAGAGAAHAPEKPEDAESAPRGREARRPAPPARRDPRHHPAPPSADNDTPPSVGSAQAGRKHITPGTKMVGSVQVVVLDPEDERDLPEQIAEARKNSGGRPLLLQTSATKCMPCQEIETSLSDPRMQRALGSITLVTVDLDAFREDLEELRIKTDTLPWFYKLNDQLRPVDAISAGEWDDNIPANMAPVLDAFLHGKPFKRREPSPTRSEL